MVVAHCAWWNGGGGKGGTSIGEWPQVFAIDAWDPSSKKRTQFSTARHVENYTATPRDTRKAKQSEGWRGKTWRGAGGQGSESTLLQGVGTGARGKRGKGERERR